MVAILLLGFVLKSTFEPGLGRGFLDGNYYFQIAQQVERGEGLTTRVSLYHQGLKTLPHPASGPPLWPLLLGFAGRTMDLREAAELLPEALYLLDLALLFLLLSRLDEPAARRRPFAPRWQHLVVLLLALNPLFFQMTSVPYTEALAFAGLFGFLLLVDAYDVDPTAAKATAVGLAAALTFMARGQFVGLIPAALLLVGVVVARRRASPAHLAWSAAGSALALVPWALWMAAWAKPFRLWYLVAAGGYKETPELKPFQSRVPVEGLWGRFEDLLEGARVSVSWWDPDSYVAVFGAAVFVLPLALIPLVRDPGAVSTWWREVGRERRLLAPATALASVACLLPVHTVHARFFREWLFGYRHGLPLVLLVGAATFLAWSSRWRALRFAVAALLLVGVTTAARETGDRLSARSTVGLSRPEFEALRWIETHGADTTVVTTRAQSLGPYTNIGIHWMECRESGMQTKALFEAVGVDFLLAYPNEAGCRFVREARDRLRLERVFGAPQGLAVFSWSTPAKGGGT